MRELTATIHVRLPRPRLILPYSASALPCGSCLLTPGRVGLAGPGQLRRPPRPRGRARATRPKGYRSEGMRRSRPLLRRTPHGTCCSTMYPPEPLRARLRPRSGTPDPAAADLVRTKPGVPEGVFRVKRRRGGRRRFEPRCRGIPAPIIRVLRGAAEGTRHPLSGRSQSLRQPESLARAGHRPDAEPERCGAGEAGPHVVAHCGRPADSSR